MSRKLRIFNTPNDCQIDMTFKFESYLPIDEFLKKLDIRRTFAARHGDMKYIFFVMGHMLEPIKTISKRITIDIDFNHPDFNNHLGNAILTEFCNTCPRKLYEPPTISFLRVHCNSNGCECCTN